MPASSLGWLLDTNVVSELRKDRAHPAVRRWALGVPPGACFLSSVTIAEIRFGIEQVGDTSFRFELETWLRDGVCLWFGERVLAVSEQVLLVWRQLAAEGRKRGYTYSQPDALIAATAMVHQLCVVTRNVADFQRAGVAVVDPWSDC